MLNYQALENKVAMVGRKGMKVPVLGAPSIKLSLLVKHPWVTILPHLCRRGYFGIFKCIFGYSMMVGAHNDREEEEEGK